MDCTRANTGLFVGIFVMVLTIISVIVFFVLITSEDGKLRHAAIMVASLTELSLYTLTTIAVMVGMFQVNKPSPGLNRWINILIVIGLFIIVGFSTFRLG